MEKQITAKLNGEPIRFLVTTDNHAKLIDELTPNNKVVPQYNFLVRSVVKEDKQKLFPFLESPAAVVHLAPKILEAFTPELKIEVGE